MTNSKCLYIILANYNFSLPVTNILALISYSIAYYTQIFQVFISFSVMSRKICAILRDYLCCVWCYTAKYGRCEQLWPRIHIRESNTDARTGRQRAVGCRTANLCRLWLCGRLVVALTHLEKVWCELSPSIRHPLPYQVINRVGVWLQWLSLEWGTFRCLCYAVHGLSCFISVERGKRRINVQYYFVIFAGKTLRFCIDVLRECKSLRVHNCNKFVLPYTDWVVSISNHIGASCLAPMTQIGIHLKTRRIACWSLLFVTFSLSRR